MAYIADIDVDKYAPYLSPNLLTHIDSDQTADASIIYSHPKIIYKECNKPEPKTYKATLDSLRLPSRINMPLIKYPECILQFYRTGKQESLTNVHGHHSSSLKRLQPLLTDINRLWIKGTPEITDDLNILKSMASLEYGSRDQLIHHSAAAYARRATQHELEISAMKEIPQIKLNHNISPYSSFLITIQRLRVFIGKCNQASVTKFDEKMCKGKDFKFILYPDYSYSYSKYTNTEKIILISASNHMAIYHSDIGKWYVGSSVHLDYMFTMADIINNLEIISNSDEYKWCAEFIKLLIELASSNHHHNTCVDFMKGLEGFLLNMSDYDEEYAMNWKPILESAHDLWSLDKDISNLNYDYGLVLGLIRGLSLSYNPQSYLCRIINISNKMTRTQRQEASSLHKFIFYAEIVERPGIEKFLDRVHTPRIVDKDAVKNLTRVAKLEFLLAYRKKHNSLPNLRGDMKKIKWLQITSNRKQLQSIRNLPLSWWDDIQIFKCMDNTLTDDPLEFAKDKGALKKEIHHGPGDSRKELLQVIESEDYKLKDFFAQGPFVPKCPTIYQTKQHREPQPCKHPVRIMPKEREQKKQSRNFGNGEMTDKHSLSVIATKMKKILSYYDEQMMTPSDKNRKKTLHRAAQMLKQRDTYSMLLDIEGHNQSMQANNTAELAEFCGHLFGEEGWGTLPDYFSVIEVFHYEEYLDEVIISRGQLGGIEGWLNPFWTLHSTLIMKLVRIMTSLNLELSMAYSDDIDGIITIEQANEYTVQAAFQDMISHFLKFGLVVKMSQTALSKHRVTMLRQHYADGIRADATLKKLISVSGANNNMVMADSLEVAGICSSIASALEMSNHITTCIYLKNYKIGLLLARYPHMILSRPMEGTMFDDKSLPVKLATLLYHVKDESNLLNQENYNATLQSGITDIALYLKRNPKTMNIPIFSTILNELYASSIALEKFIDSADKLLYLQLYDPFLQDLLFFWAHMPESLGGFGAPLVLNLILSGHSSGMSKCLHYLKEWIFKFSADDVFFSKYLNTILTIDKDKIINFDEGRLLSSYWPSDITCTTATTSINSAIKSMIRKKTKNKTIKILFDLDNDSSRLRQDIIDIFRNNYHQRIAQFYYENTSVHFLDLLIKKIETSSGLLSSIRSLTRLRNSLCSRSIENLRTSARPKTMFHDQIYRTTDIIETLIIRRKNMFPKVNMVNIDEPLYDDKLMEVNPVDAVFTCRQCSPMHFENGIPVYDDPDVGNEIRYKGELLDDDRMLGNKEEFLAAKLVAVTKWFLTKQYNAQVDNIDKSELDCVKACNLALSTLTGQTINDLWKYSPNETGGEILHRIPNMRFSTSTYIRSDMNRSLRYTVDMVQKRITDMYLIDSNVNFDYVRLRLLVAAMVRDLNINTKQMRMDWAFCKQTTFTDVQFITPMTALHTITKPYTCYGILRGHTFSELRYRFMATYYLNITEIPELGLIPIEDASITTTHVTIDLMKELIVNYALKLDHDYMRATPLHINEEIWAPLINKINTFTDKLSLLTIDEQMSLIKDLLIQGLNDRDKITVLSPTDKVPLSIQSQCLSYIEIYRPKDIHYEALVKNYSALSSLSHRSEKLLTLCAKYQNILTSHTMHREKLCVLLLCEYIIMFHFKITRRNHEIFFNATASYNELAQEGIATMSSTLISPKLGIQLLILGIDTITNVLYTKADEIKAILWEISMENHLADIIVPTNLPNLKQISDLDGTEELTNVAREIVYALSPLPYSAMETIEDIQPLLNFARKCVDIGSHPIIYESATGSDSYMAQFGLFNMLMKEFEINDTTQICDLTAGRGDMQYVSRELGLSTTSFGLPDIFTSVIHHPAVDYSKQYDIGKMATLKFIFNYDWIHIDVSFVGTDKLNVLDLILTLESNNLGYSIRLNSVSLIGYIRERLEGLPTYTHYLSYCTNSRMKPYQVYLVGVPGDLANVPEALSMKQTAAFRSMALAFSTLLSPYSRGQALETFSPNSSSIYITKYANETDMLMDICNRAAIDEENYYIRRYITEISNETIEYIIPELMVEPPIIIDEVLYPLAEEITENVYTDRSPDAIGNVSAESLRYHQNHLIGLQTNGTKKIKVDLLNMHQLILSHLRTHHPLMAVRTKCNVIMGCHRYTRLAEDINLDSAQTLYNHLTSTIGPKATLHHQEYQSAIKLLCLSASKDTYWFGIHYCAKMVKLTPNRSTHYLQILKIYRSLSYLYPRLHRLISWGSLTNRAIAAIEHEFLQKESIRVRYNIQDNLHTNLKHDEDEYTPLLEIQFDSLFTQLEGFLDKNIENELNNDAPPVIEDMLGRLTAEFDLSIEDKVDQYLELNPNIQLTRHGTIYLGDDDPVSDEDMW
jgi:5S rRNA maturation endonuclease (ribonuclease M5)